jgi:two-component system KDP operon response regulator KdpE
MAVLPDPGFTSHQPKILLVCDRPEETTRWRRLLPGNLHVQVAAGSLDQIFEAWGENIPDLVLIDVQAPRPDEAEICWHLRQEAAVPLLVVFETFDEGRILQAYRAGADDCLVKPLSPELLFAKLNAWRRRSWTVPAEILTEIRSGGVHLDPVRRMAILESGRIARLTNLEFRLLTLLMSNPGRALPAGEIVNRVWGFSGEADGGVMLKNVVYRLRKKIEPDPGNPTYLLTEPGLGYRFSGSKPKEPGE